MTTLPAPPPRPRTRANLGLAGTCLLTGLIASPAAQAHVVLAEPVALAGTAYRATLRVGHGCQGSPTTALTVFVPAGVRGAKPMPKPGWTLRTRSAALTPPETRHGKTVREDVVEVHWQASSPEAALPDGWYDEFVLHVGLPAQGGQLWWRVLQTCAQGQLDWAQVPARGSSTRGLPSPAVPLEVIPPGPSGPNPPEHPAHAAPGA